MILRSLLVIATPYDTCVSKCTYTTHSVYMFLKLCIQFYLYWTITRFARVMICICTLMRSFICIWLNTSSLAPIWWFLHWSRCWDLNEIPAIHMYINLYVYFIWTWLNTSSLAPIWSFLNWIRCWDSGRQMCLKVCVPLDCCNSSDCCRRNWALPFRFSTGEVCAWVYLCVCVCVCVSVCVYVMYM